MGAVTSSAGDIITDALIDLNVLAPGEPLDATEGGVALRRCNDLLESLSNDKFFVYTADNSTVAWTPGKFQYTIGNPTAGTFAGTLTQGSAVITGITATLNVTTGINAAGSTVGGTLTDVLASIPANTTIVSYNAGAGTLTMSAPAISTQALDQITYTAPGDFAINRPLRFRPGFTRITAAGNTGLDYWWDVATLDDYNEIGYKGVPGPWPYLICYQPSYPYGTLWVYPSPQQAGEVHFFTDVILGDLQSITQPFSLPQGYARALKKLLAIELAPGYGKNPSPALLVQAREARDFIRSMNQTPVKKLRYDSAIMAGNGKDASFILHGGFGSNL